MIKVYVIKDQFAFLVIESVIVKNYVILLNIYYENCNCRKKLVDKIVEECTENIDEEDIAGMALFGGCMFLHNIGCFGCNRINNQH